MYFLLKYLKNFFVLFDNERTKISIFFLSFKYLKVEKKNFSKDLKFSVPPEWNNILIFLVSFLELFLLNLVLPTDVIANLKPEFHF